MTAIVILHYMNVNVTTKCLSCLRKSPEFSTLRVIIVDNGSPNDSGEVLREMYTSIPNITVIRNAENLGFSAGNNVGYRVARERFHADQILVINSDLYIQDLHFFKELDALTKANPEDAILAPDILNAAGEHQNPHKLKISKSSSILYEIFRNRVFLQCCAIPKMGQWILKHRKQPENQKWQVEQWGIIPHGSCLIFQPVWVKSESFAFREGTFLYREEDILADYCREKRYCIHYTPQLRAFHESGSSTNLGEVNPDILEQKKRKVKLRNRARWVQLRYRLKDRLILNSN